MKDVILIDADTGNLRSVQKALESTGANVKKNQRPGKSFVREKDHSPGRGCVRRLYVRVAGARAGRCGQRCGDAWRAVAGNLC